MVPLLVSMRAIAAIEDLTRNISRSASILSGGAWLFLSKPRDWFLMSRFFVVYLVLFFVSLFANWESVFESIAWSFCSCQRYFTVRRVLGFVDIRVA